MLKALLFDLDGVLVEFAKIHEECFIEAWNRIYFEHKIDLGYTDLEARTTKSKIKMLISHFNLQTDEAKELEIFNLKQQLTLDAIRNSEVYPHTLPALKYAKSLGLKLAVCSNSTKQSVIDSIEKLGATEIFDIILSNNDVTNPKPHPEIYLKAMKSLEVEPEECLIFEDSVVGKQAALKALAGREENLIHVKNAMEVDEKFIQKAINGRQMCLKSFLDSR